MDDARKTDKDKSGEHASQWFKFFDENGRYLQYCAYGAALAGVILVSRSIRLGSKFTSAASIPREFYTKNVNLYGLVRSINKTEGIFNVEHKPIISFSNQKRNREGGGLLRLQVLGLEFVSDPDKVSKLESKILNQNIKFTLIEYDEKHKVSFCLIFSKGFLLLENFGVWCIRNDIGVMNSSQLLKDISPGIWGNKLFSLYYNAIFQEQNKKDNPSTYQVILKRLKSMMNKIRYRSIFRNKR